jgi:phospholipid/cholesterol/gamma-HCH transport system substrate-binding protein
MRLTAAGTLLACLATGCSLQPNENTLPGQVATGSDGYGVTVRFEAVENLVPNSQVLLDDVVVGTVTAIRVDDWHAVADLRLLDSVPISDRARFTIGQKTLLGAQYVDIDSPPVDAAASPVGLLGDGDEVPLSRTGQAPGTEQVLAGVALLLNNGGLSQISTITSELTTALDERQLDARDLVTRSNELLTVLDDTKGEIINTLESLESLSRGLADDREVIARASGRASTRAVGVIQASQEAILANLDSLGPILSQLGKTATRLPEALKIAITVPFPAMTTEKTLRGDYSNLFATIDVSAQSLADLLLGTGQLPSLQSGDPLTDPLQQSGGNGNSGQGGPRAEDAEGGSGSGADGKPPVEPDDGRGEGDGACLLGLLGDC